MPNHFESFGPFSNADGGGRLVVMVIVSPWSEQRLWSSWRPAWSVAAVGIVASLAGAVVVAAERSW